ncbi:FG-GAP repeat protein [Trypanosoma brucei equiperdum]|uniref:FG-GAP repeat protein n=1 Tax=Trypanosoma brucei equiperdum TaxID=630700 RepID=A0A3L6L5P1_9TRYP|nr:FG-GAP repeat protein [Trypanosoma brucei equiperdum]
MTLTGNITTIFCVLVILCTTVVNAIPLEWSEPLAHKSPHQRVLQEDLLPHARFAPTNASTTAHTCRSGVYLEWSTRVGSSVLATPRIVDLNYDGNKEILVPTYSQYIEAVDGASGADIAGFPFVHPNIKTYASPIPVDILDDGATEWLVAMYTGELLLIGGEGETRGGVKVPSLPIKKRWFHRNISNSIPANGTLAETPAEVVWMQETLRMKRVNDLVFRERQLNSTDVIGSSKLKGHDSAGEDGNGESTDDKGGEVPPRKTVHGAVDQRPLNQEDAQRRRKMEKIDEMFEFLDPEDGAVEDPADDPNHLGSDVSKDPRGIGTDGWLSAEARESMDLLYHPELYKSSINFEEEYDPFNSNNLLNPTNVATAEDEVAVDPHIMSTPVVASVDGRGETDVVLHVSYYFDPRDYERRGVELSQDGAQVDNYVADVLMVVNLARGEVKWLKVLHLTTKNDTAPAFAFSSPTVTSINDRKQRDIFVTTTAGAIFGFQGDGTQLKGWPVWMNSSITASVSVEDVDGDGVADVCTGDALGYVACFTKEGKKIWSKRFSGAVGDHIAFGDINGDGDMDMAFGTATGLIYAVKGSDGSLLPQFPIATEGPIVASPLLVRLDNASDPKQVDEKGLHIIVPSHDGVLYIVKGTTGCVDAIDTDEKSSVMVLADDVTGNGMLDLVVSTLSGSIMVFGTATKFHPLKAWPSRVKSLNGFTAAEGHIGVFIHPSSRVPRDIHGDKFSLTVTIYDDRKGKDTGQLYNLAFTLGPHVSLGRYLFDTPGTYAIQMHSPLVRMYGTVSVVLTLPDGQMYEDTLALSFNMHFLESVKYTFLIPFLTVWLAHSFVMEKHQVPLTG